MQLEQNVDLLTNNTLGPPISLIKNKYVEEMNFSIDKSVLDMNVEPKILPNSVIEVYDVTTKPKGEPWETEQVKKLSN